MTWQQYAKLWLKRHIGDVSHLTREQTARYIIAVIKFERATPMGQALLILQLEA